ncbi:nucleotide exchange factor GrpE [Candidatus Woesearchaeota archaeon]|nr:nucleotide exchange factor GrpE [Candidatus Woesearchaeota archaeon]
MGLVDLRSTGCKVDKNKRKDDLKKKLDEYTDQLKRLQAEFENYMKRVEKEREQIVGCASERIILNVLKIYDDLERALEQMKDSEDKQGIEMIRKNIWKMLEEEGVRPIDAKGKKFDPYKHEVLLQEKTDDYDEDTVIEELQKGYMLKDKVIRHTKVKIARSIKRES